MNISLEDIRARVSEGKIKEALSLIREIEHQGPLCPAVLVLKGYCIQLDDQETPYKLSEAEQAFNRALEIDKDFIPAAIELAWFYLNVHDDAERAAKLFESAVASCRETLTEAVVGVTKCLMETEGKDAATGYLAEIGPNCLEPTEIRKAREEIEVSTND